MSLADEPHEGGQPCQARRNPSCTKGRPIGTKKYRLLAIAEPAQELSPQVFEKSSFPDVDMQWQHELPAAESTQLKSPG